MPDYQGHDYDTLMILDKWPEYVEDTRFSCRKEKSDLFFLKEQNKEQYINEILQISEQTYASRVCHFMVPEFVNHIGLTIEDLKRVESVVRLLENTRHKWYCVIYDAYIKNNGFYLTEEQKQEAYNVYKTARPRRFAHTTE